MPGIIAGAIGLLAFNAGLSLAAVNAITFGALAAVKVAVGVGLSLAASGLLKQQRVQPVSPSDGQQEIKLEVAPRRRSVGTVRVGMVRFFGSTNPAEPDSVFIGGFINHGRIGAILEHLVDNNVSTINAGTGQIETPALYADNGSDEDHFIYYRMGGPSEAAYSQLNTAFVIPNMRGDGSATVLLEFDNWESAEQQLDVFPHGIPEYQQTNTGSVVFDPREALHDRTNESTWEASENPVVHLFHYCFVDADGYGMGYERVEDNIAEWTAAMDACDALVDLNDGGTEARYRISGSYFLTDDPREVVARMLSTCDGKIWPRRDGQIGISVGVFAEPTVTIRSRDILGYEVTRGPDRLDRAGGIRAQYMSPEHSYKEQEAEPWPDGATVTALGDERAPALDLTWVPSHTQARRLMKREYIRNNADWRLTVTTNLAGLRAIDERFVNLEIDEIGIDGSFEVASFALDPMRLTTTLELVSVDASIDDWDETTEEGTPPADNPITASEINPDGSTPIGDMTFEGGLAAAFDGDLTQADPECAGTDLAVNSGWVGLTFVSPKRFKQAIVHGSSNKGFVFSAATVTLTLYGKNGATPSGPTDGTSLATLSFAHQANESAGRSMVTNDRFTEWDHLFVRIQSSVSVEQIVCAELRLFE